MGAIIICLVFILTVGIGAAVARGVLGLLLHLVVHGNVLSLASLRITGFVIAVIAFWSLAHGAVAASLIELVR